MSSNTDKTADEPTTPVAAQPEASSLSTEALDQVSGGLMASDFVTGNSINFGGGAGGGHDIIGHELTHIKNQ